MKSILLWNVRLLDPLLKTFNLSAVPKYAVFFSDWLKFRSLGGKARTADLYPCLFDKRGETGIDKHYFYQAVWAMKKILASAAAMHVDVGSDAKYVGMLTAITEVVFVDIRPLNITLERYQGKKGTILALPFNKDSVVSLSCLSVAEHIGLGRYGDEIDPEGTIKACRELSRVLAPGGSLYFGLPVGKHKVCFNAHKIHKATEILGFFHGLTLSEFSAVDDDGNFVVNADPKDFDSAEFANGLFHFRK